MKMEMLTQMNYEPPRVEIIRVVLEEGLAEAARCSPIDPSGVKVEDWGPDIEDNYADIYLPDTW